jgi:glycosyltransferase involved in cell wall biosynthesis
VNVPGLAGVATAHGFEGSAVGAPLVSVAVPTWNRAHLVGRAIRSVLAQTFPDIEILVVDDGSTDTTPEVVGAVDDARLRPVRHERNHGISRTRNTALRLARGEWLAFLDDDNEWAPDYLARQLALAASRPEAGVVYCRARLRDIPSGSEHDDESGLYQGRVFHHLVGGWNPWMSATLIRRSVLTEVGGLDERLRATEDHDLWLRLALCTNFAGMSDVLLTRYLRHGAQLSRNPEFRLRDVAILDAKWRTAITKSCGRVAYRRWHLRLAGYAERLRVEQARGTGVVAYVAAAARGAGRLSRHLPWSAPLVGELLATSIAGYRGGRLVRQAWRQWYRVRQTLGFPAIR